MIKWRPVEISVLKYVTENLSRDLTDLQLNLYIGERYISERMGK